MKKLTTLLLATLLIIGCSSTPQEKAEKAVTKNIETTIKENPDYKAYQPISFGQIDTIQLTKQADYQLATDSFQYFRNQLNVTADQTTISQVQQKTKAFKQEIESLENFYRNKKFSIQHQYKIEVKGKTYDRSEIFYLNSQYKIVE